MKDTETLRTAFFREFVLYVELEDALRGSRTGSCDAVIAELVKKPEIAQQIDLISLDVIRKELAILKAWGNQELEDDEQNRERLLWQACGQIRHDELLKGTLPEHEKQIFGMSSLSTRAKPKKSKKPKPKLELPGHLSSPWTLDEKICSEGRFAVMSDGGMQVCATYEVESAKVIIQAVNAHEALVKACQAALETFRMKCEGQHNWPREQLVAALALAEKEVDNYESS